MPRKQKPKFTVGDLAMWGEEPVRICFVGFTAANRPAYSVEQDGIRVAGGLAEQELDAVAHVRLPREIELKVLDLLAQLLFPLPRPGKCDGGTFARFWLDSQTAQNHTRALLPCLAGFCGDPSDRKQMRADLIEAALAACEQAQSWIAKRVKENWHESETSESPNGGGP